MKRTGFTFAEVLIAIVLIGIAIASLVGANSAFSKSNGAAIELSTAEFLIEQIRELMVFLPVTDPQTGAEVFGPEDGEAAVAAYDDIDDFDDTVFSPPIDLQRQTLSELSGFSQRITVKNVSDADFSIVQPDLTTSFVKVTVGIIVNSRTVSTASWIHAGTD